MSRVDGKTLDCRRDDGDVTLTREQTRSLDRNIGHAPDSHVRHFAHPPATLSSINANASHKASSFSDSQEDFDLQHGSAGRCDTSIDVNTKLQCECIFSTGECLNGKVQPASFSPLPFKTIWNSGFRHAS